MIETETYVSQRERSPRRRSRSPRSSRRRSYSPRSRSRSREDRHRTDRRSRSPISGGMSAAGGVPHRSFEERAQAREQMLSSLRESSQQDRRVYVGNLSYDVKWHHLKDFMRSAGEVLFADVLLLPNGMSKFSSSNSLQAPFEGSTNPEPTQPRVLPSSSLTMSGVGAYNGMLDALLIHTD
jgi:RNA recognition motif-containing protein